MDRKLQVFVSSTYTDLVDERQAAVSAILKAGHMPAGMELFTAANKSQWDTITKWIDESDVYLLILGGRYGSVEAVSGLSYTELEFDYAVSKNKPLFAIVEKEEALENKVKSRGSEVIEKDNAPKLKKFREKVLSNISSFFSDEKDIRIAVMESLMHLSDVHAKAGWVRASTVVDTQSLEQTIVRLRDENTQLESAVNKLKSSAKKSNSLDDFEALKAVLEKTEIFLPDGTSKRDLMRITLSYLDIFVQGITSSTSGDVGAWLYGSVGPKLILHGLANSIKPTGTFYFKTQLTSDGLRFFSRLTQEQAMGSNIQP